MNVFVKDGKGTAYDIEIQVTDTKELLKRIRYYRSLIDKSLLLGDVTTKIFLNTDSDML